MVDPSVSGLARTAGLLRGRHEKKDRLESFRCNLGTSHVDILYKLSIGIVTLTGLLIDGKCHDKDPEVAACVDQRPSPGHVHPSLVSADLSCISYIDATV